MEYNQAASGTLGSYVPTQLFAGEVDVVTNNDTVLTGKVLARYTVLGRITASKKLVAWDPAATDGSEKPMGILAVPLDTSATGTNADTAAPYYVAGGFNHEALVWPAAVSTLAARKAAFDKSPIVIGSLRGATAWTQT